MGSVGDAYDNAMCESFFATLEYELAGATQVHVQDRGQDGLLQLRRRLVQPNAAALSPRYRSPMAYEAVMEAVTTEP
jgi:putative transposase